MSGVRFKANGSASVLLGGGEVMLSPREARELFSLLDLIREQGRGSPEFVLGWMQENPRRITSLLASALIEHGYDPTCEMCAQGADGRRYSVAKARRRFGLTLSRPSLAEHRRHARERERRPYRPKDARPASVPDSMGTSGGSR